MRKKLAESMCLLLGHPNILGLHAARAAYRHGGPWLDALLIYLKDNRDVLTKFVAEELPGIDMQPPEGTYLGWLDCRGLGLSVSPHTFFLEKAKVAVNEGADFGEVGEGFVRINFGCPRAVLLQGLTKMKAALDQR